MKKSHSTNVVYSICIRVELSWIKIFLNKRYFVNDLCQLDHMPIKLCVCVCVWLHTYLSIWHLHDIYNALNLFNEKLGKTAARDSFENSIL